MTLETFLIIFAFIFGSFFGSFFNVIIYRLPRDESIIIPGSHCTLCGEPIKWYDNIPLFSYFILGGKCRYCKEPFSFRYFVVELVTAILFAMVVRQYLPVVFEISVFQGLGLILFHFFFVGGLIISAFIDIDHQIIPNEITFPGIPLGLLASFLFPAMMYPFVPYQVGMMMSRWSSLLWSFVGAVAGGGSLYVIGIFGKLVLKKEAMGMGDVKLLAMIGAFIGWQLMLLTVLFASFTGAMVGGILMASKKAKWQSKIPFGPYIVLGALISYFWGKGIILWYMRLFLPR